MRNQPPSTIPVLYITFSPPNGVSKSELYRTTNAFLWKLSHFTDTHLYLPLRQGQYQVVSNGHTTNLEVRLYDPELGVGLSEYIGEHPHNTQDETIIFCPRHYARCDETTCRHDRTNPRPQPASNRRKGDNK